MKLKTSLSICLLAYWLWLLLPLTLHNFLVHTILHQRQALVTTSSRSLLDLSYLSDLDTRLPDTLSVAHFYYSQGRYSVSPCIGESLGHLIGK